MAHLGVTDLFNVKDMVFVVTGGGSGLGEWMSLALDRNGASKIFILGRRPEALEKTAKQAARSTSPSTSHANIPRSTHPSSPLPATSPENTASKLR